MDVAVLPTDILCIIFSDENSFDLNNRLALRLVSRRWKEMIQRVRISVEVKGEDGDAPASAAEKLSTICTIFPYIFFMDLISSTLQATHLRSLHLITELRGLSFPRQYNEAWIKELSMVPCSTRLKQLSMPWYSRLEVHAPVDGAQYLTHFSLLETLVLYSRQFTEAAPFVACLSSLTDLSLETMIIQPNDIAKLTALTLLKRFLIRSYTENDEATSYNVMLSRDDLATIGTYHRLEELRLEASYFSANDFHLLHLLTNLTEMDVPNVVVRANAIGLLTSFTELRKISWVGHMPFASLVQLSQYLPNIRSMHVPTDFKRSDEWLAVVGSFTNLRELYFGRQATFTDAGVKNLSKLTRLVSLRIFRRSTLTAESILTIIAFTNLNELVLNFCPKISSESFRQLTVLGRLRTLQLCNSQLTTDTLQQLFVSLPLIDTLEISSTAVTSLKGIENLEYLSILGANGCAIDDEGVSHITVLTSVVTLELNGTMVTGVGLRGAKFSRVLAAIQLTQTDYLESSKRVVPPPLALTEEGAKAIVATFVWENFQSDYQLPNSILRIFCTKEKGFCKMKLRQVTEDALPLLLNCTSLRSLSFALPKFSLESQHFLKLTSLVNLKKVMIFDRQQKPDYRLGSNISVSFYAFSS